MISLGSTSLRRFWSEASRRSCPQALHDELYHELLPLLVIGRCWRKLLGMTITGSLLAGLSLAFVGWNVNVGYLDVLLSFRKSTSGGGLGILTWKYMDLNNTLRLLCGGKTSAQFFAFVVLSLVPFVLLVQAWRRWPRLEKNHRQRLWAATLAWVPILNLYVGIYDSVLVVQSAVLATDIVLRDRRSESPLTHSGLAYWLVGIAATAWFSQSLARVSGVQVFTLVLIGLGFFLLRETNLRGPIAMAR